MGLPDMPVSIPDREAGMSLFFIIYDSYGLCWFQIVQHTYRTRTKTKTADAVLDVLEDLSRMPKTPGMIVYYWVSRDKYTDHLRF